MFNFFKPAEPDPKQVARQLYEKVTALSSDSHDARSARLRVGMLIRAHVDKTFVNGAEQTAAWQEKVALAVVQGEEKPPLPQASEYLDIKSGSKPVCIYLPMEYAEAFFEMGARYQRTQMDARQAILEAQALMDRICFQDLQLETPFEVLKFLREELEHEAPAPTDPRSAVPTGMGQAGIGLQGAAG